MVFMVILVLVFVWFPMEMDLWSIMDKINALSTTDDYREEKIYSIGTLLNQRQPSFSI